MLVAVATKENQLAVSFDWKEKLVVTLEFIGARVMLLLQVVCAKLADIIKIRQARDRFFFMVIVF